MDSLHASAKFALLLQSALLFFKWADNCWAFTYRTNCSADANLTDTTTVQLAWRELMGRLIAGANATQFNTSSVHVPSSDDDAVYGLFECRGDILPAYCYQCALSANATLYQKCGSVSGGRIWMDLCYLRWELDDDFIGELDDDDLWFMINHYNASSPAQFNKATQSLLIDLTNEAVAVKSGHRYAKNVTQSTIYEIYGMVQCWQDISAYDCRLCLTEMYDFVAAFSANRVGSRFYYGSCFMRYEIYDFFTPTSSPASPLPPPPSAEKGKSGKMVVFIVLGTILGSVALAILLFLSVGKLRKPRHVYARNLSQTTEFTSSAGGGIGDEDLGKGQHVIFTWKMLAEATNNFSSGCKLGEGAYGSVYKGTLPDGTVIAVKKLSSQSTKESQEFMNEVRLLAEIQHRNLVTLLGCCVDGDEQMLVCEYMANNSLDKIIFDAKKKEKLNWAQRSHIIEGVARGLSYLHEDSRVRIIHRDIKAANVLLDENMNAKIADFGFAKLSPEDKSDIGSRIIGTLGYLAPEYIMEGRISVKVDVYSFGVLTLEIISGRKNSQGLFSNEQSLIEKAWKLNEKGRIWEIVDDVIKDESDKEELLRFLQVALLCIQGDPHARPTMTRVIVMLCSNVLTVPNATVPPRAFLPLDEYSTSANTSSSVGVSSLSCNGSETRG